MPLDPADLPVLAALFAPMATPEGIAALVGTGQEGNLPAAVGLHGDVAATQQWLAALTDPQARLLLGRFPPMPVVVAALARLPGTPEPAPRPDGPWRLVLDMFPAVNRDTFWRHLKEMVGPRRRILVVRGGRQVGKTFTGEAILAELPRRNKAVPIRVIYQRVDGANTVTNVVGAILGKLELAAQGAPLFEDAKKEWWIKEMVTFLLGRIHADTTRQVWLALDGHVKNGDFADLAMFFAELMRQVGRSTFLANGCRLILIDYPEVTASPGAGIVVLNEDVEAATEADVVQFLDDVRGQQPDNLTRAAAIWAKVQAEEAIDRMPMLAEELIAVVGGG